MTVSGVRVIESHHLSSDEPMDSSVTVVNQGVAATYVTNVLTQTATFDSDNIIAVHVLTGAQGPPGADGFIGADGASAYDIAVENGFVGTEAEWLASIEGTDGREVEIQNSGTFIQWRYVGEVVWNDIISIAAITGADGADGSNANEIAPFSIGGVISVASYGMRIYANRNCSITHVRISAGTAPTGSSIKVDVNKNGTTIFTNQANRPEIPAGGNTDTSIPDVTTLLDGDYITFDIDQVGSTVAGSDLVIQVVTTI